ncbi:MAG: hypothetical protein ACYDGW_12240 [Vulcanimicrobiaceae bacterium]
MIHKPENMQRGRGQLLQRYRPDQTFDHESHFIACVVDYRPDRSYDEEIDRGRLIEIGARYVRRWRADAARALNRRPDGAPTFPPDTAVASNFYDIIVPASLNFSFYPLTVTCGNAQCRRVYVLPRAPEPGQEIGRCPSCHADPSYQMQYLLVHGCGHVKAFEPPRLCDAGCQNKGFRLDARASRFRDFRWVCMNCGAAKEVVGYCDNQACGFQAKIMHPEVHTSGQAYVPHNVRVVNPPSPGDRSVAHTAGYRLGVVGKWLDVCTDAEFEALRTGVNQGMPPAVREAIAALRDIAPDRAAELEAKYAPLDMDRLRERIGERIGVAVAADDLALMLLSSQLETYDRTMRRGSITLQILSDQAASESRRVLYERYPLSLTEAGLDPEKVVLVPDFPVIELAVGYSRGGYTASEADLRSYRGAQAKRQSTKTVFYAHPQRTEAIVFGLDRSRLMRWLDANALASSQETGGAAGLVHWFARYLSRRGDELEWIEFERDPQAEDRAGDAVVRLIHSMSHQFIRALSVDSGFMETSLSEHFFPYHLSFAIYPRANGEFVVGGLRTVMEQALDEVVRRALGNDACLYDPNCIVANRGADHGCLFLPETACSFRNRNSHLSRWELFGSPEGSFIGYWDTRLDA